MKNTEASNGGSDRWLEFRRQMPVARRWAYFDHAAVAPLCEPARLALLEWADDMALNGDVDWARWRSRVDEVRALAAQLINSSVEEVALVRNTTEGVNLVAEGFPWKAGENVVLPAREFPTNLLPWLALRDRGVEARIVPNDGASIDLGALERACDSRTRLIALSWVSFASGWRNDLDRVADIAHRRGALLFVDAIQGLGVFELDVRQTQVDFLAADGHKWMLGPEGAGIFYVRQEHLERLRPLGIGWNSVPAYGAFEEVDALDLRRSAGRYEGGSYNMAGVHALGAALGMLLEHGIPELSRRLLDVTENVCEALRRLDCVVFSRRDVESASGIVAIDVPGATPARVRQACLERDVVVNCRGGHVRVSPHVYQTAEDVSRLAEAVSSVVR